MVWAMLSGASEAWPNAGALVPPVALGANAANVARRGLSEITRWFALSNRLKM